MIFNPSSGKSAGDATAAAGDILAGKTAYGADGKLTGTMPNNGTVTQELSAGEDYTIPAGYHSGGGKVTASPLSEQTSGTAAAADILSGKTAWVNGVQVSGSMVNRGSVTQSLNAGGSYTIPAGYHSGAGKVTANSLTSQTSATATAGDIANGKTAWVNGVKITGTGSILEETTFDFLCHGLGGRIRIHTDLAGADPSNENASRGYYLLDEGDRSTHTLKCTVGSYVTIFLYACDLDVIRPSEMTGFEDVESHDDNQRELVVVHCVEPNGSINVSQR